MCNDYFDMDRSSNGYGGTRHSEMHVKKHWNSVRCFFYSRLAAPYPASNWSRMLFA